MCRPTRVGGLSDGRAAKQRWCRPHSRCCPVLDRQMQMPKSKPFEIDLRDGGGVGARGLPRQSGSFRRWLRVGLRQSGMAAATAVVVAAASGCATAQQAPFEVALRDGSLVAARSVAGDASGGFDLQTANGDRLQVAATAVLAIHGAPVVVPALAAAHLAGGDVVRQVPA